MVKMSISFTVAAVVLGVLVALVTRPRRRTLLAAAAGGVAVSLFDILGAYTAHRMDWWHLKGALTVGSVPLVFNIGWIFLGGAFCLVYHRGSRRGLTARWRALIVLLAAAVGVGNDALLRHLGILSLGQGMLLVYTYPYWVICILLTLGTFRTCRGTQLDQFIGT